MTNGINLGLPFSKCYEPNCYIFKNLLQCGGCHIALYCSLQHQKSHRQSHKAQCKPIKDTEIKLAQAEKELRARSGDERCPENPFENAVGTFWFWEATRPYMRERYNLMLYRLNIGTGEALESALTDCLDMLRLCRGDNQSARDQVPALLLRLGRDQDAYDHIKWWATSGLSPTYDWRNPSEPFLDLHEEDAFEHSDVWMAKLWDLSFKSSMALLKIRLLLDVKGLQAHAKMHPGLSYEKKMEWVAQEARSDIIHRRRDIIDRDNYDDVVADLKGQVNKLYIMTKLENRHYWPALLNPGHYCNAKPTLCTPGSKEEVVLEFQRTWQAWSECPPAIEFIRKKVRKDRS